MRLFERLHAALLAFRRFTYCICFKFFISITKHRNTTAKANDTTLWQQLATAADSWIFVDSRTQTQSWMQISRRCLYAFWTSNRASCLTHDVTRYHHRRVSSWVMRLRMLRATTSLPKQPLAFFIHYSAFLLNDQWEPAAWSLQFNLQCTDDDNRTYRNVCNMSFVSFSLALIFTINRLCPWSLKNILLSLSCEIVHYWTRLHWIFKNQD